MITIVFIRHALSQENVLNSLHYTLVGGQSESDLATEGVEQAKCLVGSPFTAEPTIVLSSCSSRSIATAKMATNRSLEDIILDARLNERSLGECEGRSIHELRLDPIYSQYFSNQDTSRKYRHSFTKRLPGAENYRDVIDRTSACLSEYLHNERGKILVFSHMVAIRCMLHWMLDLDEKETLNLKVMNCFPIVVIFDAGLAQLTYPSKGELQW